MFEEIVVVCLVPDKTEKLSPKDSKTKLIWNLSPLFYLSVIFTVQYVCITNFSH